MAATAKRFSRTCIKCGSQSDLVATLPDDNNQNVHYAIYQCLGCKFVEWLPQDQQGTAAR
jgi:predicted nucleic-acid-binding Zn-ribbon protein